MEYRIVCDAYVDAEGRYEAVIDAESLEEAEEIASGFDFERNGMFILAGYYPVQKGEGYVE